MIRLHCGAPISAHDPWFGNVKFTVQILKDIDPVIHHSNFGSSGRIRTYDQSVNSRPLYH